MRTVSIKVYFLLKAHNKKLYWKNLTNKFKKRYGNLSIKAIESTANGNAVTVKVLTAIRNEAAAHRGAFTVKNGLLNWRTQRC